MCRVVHCKKESYDVYIGRPSKWGNPFSHLEKSKAEFHVQSREDAILAYEKWILKQPNLIKSLPDLKGKVLGCWCSPLKCHGDVLAKLVKELESEDSQTIDPSS